MSVEGLDHAHVLVTDRAASMAWYVRVLGLRSDPRFDLWSRQVGAPLVLCTEGGVTALSLFARTTVEPAQDGTVAFLMTGANFLGFLDRLPELQLLHHNGKLLTRANLIDHRLSYSIYFLDPDRNRIEVTTYDRDVFEASEPDL